jgi:hypothetical protein
VTKVDVFVRSQLEQNPLRAAFFEATRARWTMDRLAVLRVLRYKGIREGRQFAEEHASGEIYIYSDDDVVVVGHNWIERGLKVMLAHPEYAVASSLSLIEGENLAKPPAGAGDIYDMHAVGAPMWVRKGILTDLPEMTLNNECGKIDDYVKAKGFKEGLITGLRHSHLGHGFSSTPGLDFGY